MYSGSKQKGESIKVSARMKGKMFSRSEGAHRPCRSPRERSLLTVADRTSYSPSTPALSFTRTCIRTFYDYYYGAGYCDELDAIYSR